MDEEPRYMTTPEAARLLRRPAETLRYWRWKNVGPRCFKVGRAVVYERVDLEAWLADQKARTGSGAA